MNKSLVALSITVVLGHTVVAQEPGASPAIYKRGSGFSAIDGESATYLETRIQITTHPVQFQQP